MTDLATLLTQLNQHAHSMENIVKAIHIPENITHAGLAHCKEYLGLALDHMIKVGDAFRAISEQHPQDLNTHDVRTASAKQDCLIVQFRALTTTLWERTPARPKHPDPIDLRAERVHRHINCRSQGAEGGRHSDQCQVRPA